MIQDTAQDKDNDLYSQLITISQKALENASYETAYHALCAALHLAHDVNDEHRLQTVAQFAKTQIDWIDVHAPEHRMSSQTSLKNNSINFYKSLLKRVDADLLIARHTNDKQRSTYLSSHDDALNSPFTEKE